MNESSNISDNREVKDSCITEMPNMESNKIPLSQDIQSFGSSLCSTGEESETQLVQSSPVLDSINATFVNSRGYVTV